MLKVRYLQKTRQILLLKVTDVMTLEFLQYYILQFALVINWSMLWRYVFKKVYLISTIYLPTLMQEMELCR